MRDTDRFYFSVRLTPSASKNSIGEWIDQSGDAIDKVPNLKVSVTTAPENGKANKALIGLLSKSWGIPKTAFVLEKGETDRNKILSVPKNYQSYIKKV